MTEEMGKLPIAKEGVVTANKEENKPIAIAALSDVDADLQARLENLRRE